MDANGEVSNQNFASGIPGASFYAKQRIRSLKLKKKLHVYLFTLHYLLSEFDSRIWWAFRTFFGFGNIERTYLIPQNIWNEPLGRLLRNQISRWESAFTGRYEKRHVRVILQGGKRTRNFLCCDRLVLSWGAHHLYNAVKLWKTAKKFKTLTFSFVFICVRGMSEVDYFTSSVYLIRLFQFVFVKWKTKSLGRLKRVRTSKPLSVFILLLHSSHN